MDGELSHSFKLVNDIETCPSPIIFAVDFSKSRPNAAGAVNGNDAKLPECV
jgi:hypothetical protein